MFRKLAASILGAILMVSGAMAQDTDIPLEFQAFPITDAAASSYWADDISLVPTNSQVVPKIYVAEVPTSDGSSIVATILWSAGLCGNTHCKAKVVENGTVIAQFPVCNVPTGHALSSDGLIYKACGEEYVLADNPPPKN